MKNLLDTNVRAELLSRVDRLTPDSKALWGKMNVNQALRHMTCSFEIAEGSIKIPEHPVPAPKFILKFILLNFKPLKGKGKAYEEVDMVKNGINPPDFLAEQVALKEAIAHFGEKQLLTRNSQGIPMSNNDWGIQNFIHTDHHLRQFGV